MINFKTIQSEMKEDILSQVTDYICDKYNCKPNEVNAKFDKDGNLKVTIEQECIDSIFDCNVTAVVTFKG